MVEVVVVGSQARADFGKGFARLGTRKRWRPGHGSEGLRGLCGGASRSPGRHTPRRARRRRNQPILRQAPGLKHFGDGAEVELDRDDLVPPRGGAARARRRCPDCRAAWKRELRRVWPPPPPPPRPPTPPHHVSINTKRTGTCLPTHGRTRMQRGDASGHGERPTVSRPSSGLVARASSSSISPRSTGDTSFGISRPTQL